MVWHCGVLLLLLLQQSPDPAEAGLKALDARNYPEAIRLFSQAVAADPKDYAAHFHLGLSYSLAGKDPEAVAEYRKTLELKPGLYQAELNLGITLLRLNQAREALEPLEAAAKAKPAEARPQLYLGDAFFATGDFPRSELAYTEALSADPKSAPAALGAGRALLRQGKLDDAEPYFRKAVEADPALRDALLELAEAQEKAARPQDALAIYQQFPETPAARERVAQLLSDAGRAAEAIPHLEWVAQHAPSAANRVALARAYRQEKQPEKALEILAAAVQSEPQDTGLRMAYGRELRDNRKFADAAQQFYRVAQARPDSKEAWSEFAAMLVSLEQFPQAIGALDRLAALGGETAGHVYLRAIVLDRAGDVKGALGSYERFLMMSQGKSPNEEFKARQRARILKRELEKK